MLWLYDKFGFGELEALQALQDGDIVHSSKLGVQGIVTGLTKLNGHLHVRLEMHHKTGVSVEKVLSPSGLYIEGFKKVR